MAGVSCQKKMDLKPSPSLIIIVFLSTEIILMSLGWVGVSNLGHYVVAQVLRFCLLLGAVLADDLLDSAMSLVFFYHQNQPPPVPSWHL